ncbi:MAG: DUF2512 family protein [Bacillaceae bacterium]|nr:DUF2512 family protein [Bacillaceae bacterium]
MTSLLMKLIICPVAVLVADMVLPNVNFDNVAQALTLGFILAVAGVVLEYFLLRRETFWSSTILDVGASFVIIYFVAGLFPRAEVTFLGAAITAVAIGVTEYFQHLYLIKHGFAEKV